MCLNRLAYYDTNRINLTSYSIFLIVFLFSETHCRV
jgi:hypothetical protein